MIPEYLSPLANHLWQSTIVLGVVALLVLALRKNSARVRYRLWFAAALKFLVPFSLLVSIGQQFEWRTPPTVTQRPLWTVAEISMPFDPAPAASGPPSAASATPRLNSIPTILVFIWVCGFAVSLWPWMRSWRRVRGALNVATSMHVELPINDISVRVVSSPALLEPAVFGILSPILLLSDGIAEIMTPQQFKAILVHELCHVRRRDNLVTAVYMAIETLFWFYPLVRWIGKRLMDERERACDEEVIRLGNEPLVYAEGILNVCKSYLESPLRCASGVTGSDLKKRIRAILNGRVADVNLAKKIVLAVTGMWVLAIPLIVGVVNVSQALQSRQDISGTWQGTLRAGARELRIVVKISREIGGLKALMYSIDQGPGSNTSSVVTVQDSNVKISFPAIGGVYEGRLNVDGNSLTGTWTQLQTVPFNLMRATADSAWAIPEPPGPPKPMAADANPVFEVATIKLSRPDDQRSPTIQIQNRRLLTWNKSVMNLITYAYSINPSEVVNGPDWLDTKYDIIGQPDGEGQPSQQQWHIMVQKLLADRFKLSFHRDKKEVSIYALTVARNGPKVAASTGDPKGPPNLAMPARGRFRARNATMVDFAGELQAVLDRPVIDQTSISGRYDFALNWSPDDFQAARLSAFPTPQQLNGEVPDLFTAIQEQLGLRLESTKGTVEVLVIDRIQRPTEN
jgi:uncharacterized protein (TIGR03435 family)